jgi:hypothetical protein
MRATPTRLRMGMITIPKIFYLFNKDRARRSRRELQVPSSEPTSLFTRATPQPA